MDARQKRLEMKGLESDVAASLVEGGFDTPRKIKAASDRELGVEAPALAIIREKIG